jgi:hypothetical protein
MRRIPEEAQFATHSIQILRSLDLGNSGIAFKENERLGGNAGTMISELDNWITASLKPIRG